MRSFTLAHISDLHVLNLRGTTPLRFLNKRLSGLGNLVGPRRGAHPAWLAEALVERLQDPAIDHVAFTGDLTNLALPSEFAAGRRLLARIGDGERLSAVPGNHDVYTRGAARSARGEQAIAPWAAGATRREAYPWVKAPTPWLRIYGLSSAVPAPAFIAWGEVGAPQLDRLAALVAEEDDAVRVRIALVHHNLHRRRLTAQLTARMRDAAALAEALTRLRFTLLLHGHTHAPHRATLASDGGAGPLVLGCGSSTWFRPDHGELAHLNLIELSPDGVGAVRSEVWQPSERRFVADRDDLLTLAAQQPLAR